MLSLRIKYAGLFTCPLFIETLRCEPLEESQSDLGYPEVPRVDNALPEVTRLDEAFADVSLLKTWLSGSDGTPDWKTSLFINLKFYHASFYLYKIVAVKKQHSYIKYYSRTLIIQTLPAKSLASQTLLKISTTKDKISNNLGVQQLTKLSM